MAVTEAVDQAGAVRERVATQSYTTLNRLWRDEGGTRPLSQCTGRMARPSHTDSCAGSRVVRLGSHATLWNHLSSHRGVATGGRGNHRGSICRVLVETALIGSHPVQTDLRPVSRYSVAVGVRVRKPQPSSPGRQGHAFAGLELEGSVATPFGLEELAYRHGAGANVAARRPVDVEPVAEDLRGDLVGVQLFLGSADDGIPCRRRFDRRSGPR